MIRHIFAGSGGKGLPVGAKVAAPPR